MAVIEEIVEEVKSIDLEKEKNKKAPADALAASTGPTPPVAPGPQRPPESHASKENPMEDWDSVPLFMKRMPKDEEEESAPLAALQSLIYDGDASEVATNFKNQGNEYFKGRRFKEAITFYTKALREVGEDIPIEERRVLWCNRAAANIELENYGKALKDLAAVIQTQYDSFPAEPSEQSQKTTTKALYRSARALIALGKLDEATDSLKHLRALEMKMGIKTPSGLALEQEVEKKLTQRQKREAEKAEKQRRIDATQANLIAAIRLSGIVLPNKPADKLFENCPTDVTPPHFDLEGAKQYDVLSQPLSETSWTPPPTDTVLIFPIFLNLPLANPATRDLCMEFHVDATFGDFLESMQQNPAALSLYIVTRQKRVLKIGNKLTLRKVIAAAHREEDGDGWELVDGWVLNILAVPKGDIGDKWIQEWKNNLKSSSS